MTPVKTLDHTDSDKAKICMKSSMKDNFYLQKKKQKQKKQKKPKNNNNKNPKNVIYISMDRSDLAMYLITVLEYL